MVVLLALLCIEVPAVVAQSQPIPPDTTGSSPIGVVLPCHGVFHRAGGISPAGATDEVLRIKDGGGASLSYRDHALPARSVVMTGIWRLVRATKARPARLSILFNTVEGSPASPTANLDLALRNSELVAVRWDHVAFGPAAPHFDRSR
jgi:hypothetical protein